MASAREVRRRATGQSSAADKEHVAINASPKHYQSISKSCYVAGFAISAGSWIDVYNTKHNECPGKRSVA